MAGVVPSPATPKTALAPTPEEKEPRPNGPSAPKNAILPHGQKPEGTAPYIPVPPKSTHPNFLTSALRRLSSSGGQLANSARSGQGGICPRKILNVDGQRERCQIPELDQSKLRRVAFCVDVEIANGPRYHDHEPPHTTEDLERNTKKKLAEKGEAEALKHPQEVEKQKETDGVIEASGEHLPKEPAEEGADPIANGEAPATTGEPPAHGEGPSTKKKEKKKRSEEERKARKEKKRKLAEETAPFLWS